VNLDNFQHNVFVPQSPAYQTQSVQQIAYNNNAAKFAQNNQMELAR
jgi:hypothetical protein